MAAARLWGKQDGNSFKNNSTLRGFNGSRGRRRSFLFYGNGTPHRDCIVCLDEDANQGKRIGESDRRLPPISADWEMMAVDVVREKGKEK